jgi:aspartyl-tRNA(Asn)/glutamyl-tRNA(Gln) amidotransferase subunit A
MMNLAELRKNTLLDISSLLKRGEITSLELVELILEQIRRTDDKIKAYVTVCAEASRKSGARADRELKTGKAKGMLHGIPISIKDNIETKGIPTTCGSKLLGDYVPDQDATVVSRLKSSGSIILGKLNLHEFAQGGVSPPTRNPWNLERTAGGSSGGSGAAVAATSTLAATGTDTAGSIRMPASVCGVVGLKPSYGRVSRMGVFPASWSLDHVGPMTRRVEDAAVLMTIMAGYDELDPTTVRSPVPNYIRAARNDNLREVTIGVPKNYFFEGCDKRIRKAIFRAIDLLSGLGCNTEEFIFPNGKEIMAARLALDMCESTSFHLQWLSGPKSKKYQPDVREYLEQGLAIPAVHYIQALRYRSEALRKFQTLFQKFDVMITPTEVMLAPPYGEKVNDNSIMQCTGPFNFLGFPALSIPCGFSDGLPIGLQIIGQLFDESRVLQIGNAYEKATRHYLSAPPNS